MIELRKLVLDVLKPHEPGIPDLAKRLAELNGVDGVNISIYEMDKEVETVKVTIEGRFPYTDEIKRIISEVGGTIHSIDEVVAGRMIVEEEETLHDRQSQSEG